METPKTNLHIKAEDCNIGMNGTADNKMYILDDKQRFYRDKIVDRINLKMCEYAEKNAIDITIPVHRNWIDDIIQDCIEE